MDTAKLIRGIEIMGGASEGSDAELVARLKSAGFSARESELLVAFVPSAFARPVLENLGVTNFVELVSVPKKGGGTLEVELDSIPVFTQALGLVRGNAHSSLVLPEHFKALAMRSAEVDAANNALNAGESLEGATFALALAGPVADVLGFDSWLARLRRLVAV
jgi:hypothetical protein